MLALLCLLSGCSTFQKRVTLFQSKTTTFAAGPHSIHIISDYYAKSYLIEGEKGLVLVDTGAQGNSTKIIGEIARIQRVHPNKKLSLIFITHAHFDHYGSAESIRQATGAPILIQEGDAPYLAQGKAPVPKVRKWGYLMKMMSPLRELVWPTPKTKPDFLVSGCFDLNPYGIDARVVALPGHTPGSSMLLLDEKYAFVGDLVSARGKVRVQDLYADNWTDIAESFSTLQAFHPAWVFPGHGESFEGSLLKSAVVSLPVERAPVSVQLVSGSASISRDDGKTWKKLRTHDSVPEHARVRTAPASEVLLIQRRTKSNLLIPENSSLAFDKLEADKTYLKLEAGRLLAKIPKLDRPSKFEVMFRSGVLGVRGPDTVLEINEIGHVRCLSGAASAVYLSQWDCFGAPSISGGEQLIPFENGSHCPGAEAKKLSSAELARLQSEVAKLN